MKPGKWIAVTLLGGAGFLAVAIVLPCMVRSGESYESSALASVKTIIAAEVVYRNSYGDYADSLSNLGGAAPCVPSKAAACLIDGLLASGVKSGYRLVASQTNSGQTSDNAFLVSAAPISPGIRGKRLFCSTEDGVIRVDSNARGTSVPLSRDQCLQLKPLFY
jgi:hypothetical protein